MWWGNSEATAFIGKRILSIMSSAQLDSLCQWVYAKRSLLSCKDEFSLNRIVESEDQTSKHPDAMVGKMVQILSHTCQHVMSGKKKSMSIAWHDICKKNITHILQPIEFGISHQPATTVRIRGDGNCFFRALVFVITGSQDEHQELRAITTTYATQCWNFIKCS